MTLDHIRYDFGLAGGSGGKSEFVYEVHLLHITFMTLDLLVEAAARESLFI
jgi:hypothetical protein